MKIIKQGKIKVDKEFTCKSCGCEFVAAHDEYKQLPDFYAGKENGYMSKCPCCGETVTRYEINIEAEMQKIQRKAKGETFYGVGKNDGKFIVQTYTETNNAFCDKCFENNNYYLTKDRCEEVVQKCNFLALLEKIHDELCPNYKPVVGEQTFAITQIFSSSSYIFGAYVTYNIVPHNTYFPSLDIAIQASSILNKKAESGQL